MKSAAFPGSNQKVVFTQDQADKARAHFEAIDERGKLFITTEEQAAMLKTIGVADLSFGGNRVWLRPGSPYFKQMFDFVLSARSVEMRPLTPAKQAEARPHD